MTGTTVLWKLSRLSGGLRVTPPVIPFMDAPNPNPSESTESSSFVANGRKPKGEYKTWKTPKNEKPTESYKQRREKRIAAYQAAVASKSKLRENGERWVDAHQIFTTGEEAIVDEENINTATTWEDISYDAVREAVAKQFLESDQSVVDYATRGTILHLWSSLSPLRLTTPSFW